MCYIPLVSHYPNIGNIILGKVDIIILNIIYVHIKNDIDNFNKLYIYRERESKWQFQNLYTKHIIIVLKILKKAPTKCPWRIKKGRIK